MRAAGVDVQMRCCGAVFVGRIVGVDASWDVVFLVEAVVVNEGRMTDLEQGYRLGIGQGYCRMLQLPCSMQAEGGCRWSIEDAAHQDEGEDGEGDSVSGMTEGIDVDNYQLEGEMQNAAALHFFLRANSSAG